MNLSLRDLVDFHVIVSLQGPVKSYIDKVPFHTAALEWDVGGVLAAELPEEQRRERYATLVREIAVQVSTLMTTLRGEEAD
jgi:hypothetical protein